MVWCGDYHGYTASLTPPLDDSPPFQQNHLPLYRYTKFRGLSSSSPVIKLTTHQRGVFSLLNSSICFNSRCGVSHAVITKKTFEKAPAAYENAANPLESLTCMYLAHAASSDLIVGGHHSLFKVDLNKPSSYAPYAHDGGISFMNYSSKLLTLGRSSGALELFDTESNCSVKVFLSSNGLLSDIDVQGNYVATCGCSVRPKRFGTATAPVEYVADPLINLYDLRTMRALAPLPFPAGASFVRFHPKLPNVLVGALASGQIQFINMFDQLHVNLYQADLTSAMEPGSLAAPTASYLSNLELSESGEYMCFSDDHKNMHMWSINPAANLSFVNYGAALDRPSVIAEPVSLDVRVSLDDPMPLNAIGMPFYKEMLASLFPAGMVFTKELSKMPRRVFLAPKTPLMRTPAFQPYNRAKMGPRNVIAEYEALHASHASQRTKRGKTIKVPRFISERDVTALPAQLPRSRLAETDATAGVASDAEADVSQTAATDEDGDLEEDTVFQITGSGTRPPPCYERLEIRYSRFGVDDFDFDYYNRSSGTLAGLENHLDNSYVNSLLQVYRFTPVFYNTVTHSLLNEYLPNDQQTLHRHAHGSSVLNELAYLFDMMHNAGSRNVSVTNFSAVLNESSVARAHELLNTDDSRTLTGARLLRLLVTFNKFLVESVVSDFQTQFDVDVQDLTATHYRLEFTSPSGDLLSTQVGSQATLDLVTPPRHVLNRVGTGNASQRAHAGSLKKNITLVTYLNYSLNQLRVLPASGASSVPVEVKQSLLKVGPILLINLPWADAEYEMIKGYKSWLVPEFYAVKTADGGVVFKPVVAHAIQHAAKYELQGFVCEVLVGPASTSGHHNLVSFVRVGDQWFLFNDFLVMPMPEKEVFDLAPAWKIPLLLVFVNVDDPRNRLFSCFDRVLFLAMPGLNDSILYRDHFAYGIRRSLRQEYELLTRQEAPQHGSLVAIDAEFVSLRPAVIELSYTGGKTLVRPAQLLLARISALRGDRGPKNGVAFIDDYIVHTGPIHDYLTTFSGIEDGDLDPVRSNKTLVTLQTAYRRLWLLSNMGCVFVGHGLKNDFRCINIQVPKTQIRDTAEFYYLMEHRRKLSLKFLAFCVLGRAVQTHNHDSIEDAHTALLLYEKYMELQVSGDFELTLQRIYSEGQQLRFRAPEPAATSAG